VFILRDILRPLQDDFSASRLGRRRSRWFVYTLLLYYSCGNRLHQTASVLASLIRDIMTVGPEMFRVGLHKGHKAPPQAPQAGPVGGCIRFPPSLSRMFPLALS